MRTEQEWAKFAKHVPVGNRIQYRNGDTILDGVLLENYPHAEKTIPVESPWNYSDLLQVQFDDETAPNQILADYEYFWHEEDECWYRFDDIMMFEDESV